MKKLVGVMLSTTLIMSYAAPLSIRALDDSLISNKDVLASTTDETGYKIYPIPLKMTEKNDILNIKNTVNLVMEENINMYTTNHVEQVLKDNGITYNVSNEVKENETNLLVGIDDEQGIVDKYFEDVNYDASISSQKEEGYVLDVDSEKNTIAIMGHENTGASYGLSTLEQILEQAKGNVKEVLIEDAPETQFRGFIEGFYGSPWSFENRASLMEFCGKYKMNTYIYGPKDDPYHASKWREPYPEDQLNELKKLVDTGKQTNVEFVWAIHVGGKIDLNSADDIQKVKDKFDQLYGIGVRQFAVFFDDSATDNTKLIEFMNDLQHNYVDQKGDMKPLILCPQFYNKGSGIKNEDYLRNLSNMDKRIQVMWTGDSVVSKIDQDVVDYIVNLIERPVYIWWNYPVNDLGRSHLLHMGPTEALAPNIKNVSGFVSNPMNQAQCNKVSLFSIADYTWNSSAYDSQTSWENSWDKVITDDAKALEAFKIFVQNCAAAPMSFADTDESVYLVPYFDAFLEKLNAGNDYLQEAAALVDKFIEISNSVEVLRNYDGTNNISSEMSGWLDTMEDIAKTGEYIFTEIQTLKPVSKDDDASIVAMIEFINEAKERLVATNNHSKKCALKRIYPFMETVLNGLEDKLYPALDLTVTVKGFGSTKVDYTSMLDDDLETYVGLGAQGIGDNFGIDLKKITDIDKLYINMAENDGNDKMSYYKEGVVEYSNDNENWSILGTFDKPVIDLNNLNIQARYVRYRATAIFENVDTGFNESNIRVNEMNVNKQAASKIYTNIDEYNSLAIENNEGLISLTGKEIVTLKPNEYIGIEFTKGKTLYNISTKAIEYGVEVSTNGEKWTTVSETNNAIEAKYIRLVNNTNEEQSFNLSDFTLKNGGVIKVIDAKNAGGSIYSGNAMQTVDGNRTTALWFSNARYTYIEYTLDTVLPLDSMNIYCEKDFLDKGHIDISEDGENWRTISSFVNAGKENNLTFAGERAKKIRLYLDKSGWVKLSEVTINAKEDMPVVTGDDVNVIKAMDNNILTSYAVNENAGTMEFNNVNSTNENVFTIIKNADSKIHVDAKVNGKWKSYGDYENVYNEIVCQDKVEAFKISWDTNSQVEIYEMIMKNKDILSADKTALQIAVDMAEAINEEDLANVLPVVVKEFKAALDEAKTILANPAATQEAVNASFDRLASAMHMLDFFKGDKAALQAFVDKVENLAKDKYIEATWTPFETALTNALNVLADENAMQEEVNETYSALVRAFLDLRLVPNKDALKDLIDQAQALNEPALANAIASAKAVYDNVNATQTEVDNAVKALNATISGLTKPSDQAPTVNPGDTKPAGSIKTGDTTSMMGTLGMISSLGVLAFLRKKRRK